MKKHIRLTSLLLVLLMVASMMPFAIFAADTTEESTVTGGGIASLEDLKNSGYVGDNDMIVYADFNGFTAGANAGDGFSDKNGHSRVLVSATGTSFYGNYSTGTMGLFNTNENDQYMSWYNDGGNIVLKYDGTKEGITKDSGHFNFFCNGWSNDNGPKDTDYVFQIDAKMGAETVKAASLFYDLTTNGNAKLSVRIESDGRLTVGGNYIGQLSDDEYTTVAIYVSPATGKYWIYIDGANVNRAGYNYSNTGDILKGIRCYQITGENALMYFDNVQFYYVNRNGSKAYDSTSYMGAKIDNSSLTYVPKLNEILSSGYADVSDVLFYADFNQSSGEIDRINKASKANSNMYGVGNTASWLFMATKKDDGTTPPNYASWITETDGNTALSLSAIPADSLNEEYHLNILPWGWGHDTTTSDTDFVYQMSVKRTADTIWGGTFIQLRFGWNVTTTTTDSEGITTTQTSEKTKDFTLASINRAGEITIGGNKVGTLTLNEYTTVAVYVDPGEVGKNGKYYLYIDGVNVTPDGCVLNRGDMPAAGLKFVRCYQANKTNNAGVEFADNAMIFDDIMLYYVNNGSKAYNENSYLGAKASLLGNSLSMEGKIGVNYYLDLNSNYVNVSDLKATFTVNGVDQESTITSTDKGYKVTAYVPAAEMMKSITGKITDKDGSVVYNFATTTAQEIAMNYVNGDYKENAKTAAKAMLNYAAAAQTYFEIDDKLANKDLSEADQKVNYTSVSNPKRTFTEGELALGYTYAGSQLQLLSSTTVYHYFDTTGTIINNSQMLMYLNGNPVDYEVVNGNQIKVKLEGFSACDLDTEYTLTLESRGNNCFTFTYSATQYIQDVINAYSTSENVKEQNLVALVKALAVYNQAADAYAAKL